MSWGVCYLVRQVLLFSWTAVFCLCSWIIDKRNHCPLHLAVHCWGRRLMKRSDSTCLSLVLHKWLHRMIPVTSPSPTLLLYLASNKLSFSQNLHIRFCWYKTRTTAFMQYVCGFGPSCITTAVQWGQILLIKKTKSHKEYENWSLKEVGRLALSHYFSEGLSWCFPPWKNT